MLDWLIGSVVTIAFLIGTYYLILIVINTI